MCEHPHLDRSRKAASPASKLVSHAHDDLPAEAVADEELWEQLETPQQLQHIACRAVHAVRA